MKKILCMSLVMVMCMSLAACGGDTKKKSEESSEVTSSPKKASVTVNPIDEAKEKLSKAYDVCCLGDDKSYASLGYDKMSLTIDTNPNDNYYRGEEDALTAIVAINAFLGLPSSLIDKMSSTRALDGMQSQNCGDFTVTWNYHPDDGMKVIYEVNP